MRSRLAAGSSFSLALLDRGEGLDLHQEVAAGQLRHGDRRALRRRRAEIALAQIGVFVEFGRLCDVADRKDNVLDRRATGIEAGVDVLADLLDLRLQVALADDTAGRVARDLPGEDAPMPAVAHRDLGRRRRSGAGWPDDDRLRKIRNGLPVGVGPPDVFLGLFPPYLQPILVVRQIEPG